jgi:hypothetical protein
MKTALNPFVARFSSAGLVPGAVSAPGKMHRGFSVRPPVEPWFRFAGQGAEKAAATYRSTPIRRAVPDGPKVIAGPDNQAALGAKRFVIGTPAVRSGPDLVGPLTQRPETRRWPVCAPNDPSVRGAGYASAGRGSTAEPVIGLHGTGGCPPLRHPPWAGCFGVMTGWVAGEGDRTAERRGS